MSRIKFLNIEVDNLTMTEAVEAVDTLIQKREPSYVVTPNVDHIVKLEKDTEFRDVYENADLILTDGMPLIWISKLKGNPIKEKVSGSDLFPKVCELASVKGYKVFLLGAAEGVAAKAAKNLKEKYKGLNIVGTYSPSYGFEKKDDEIKNIINMINKVKPDILAVGLGAPKQEKFLYKYKNKLNVPISLAIGASIDFEAGNISRAPRWMQNFGLEWAYRLFKEPRRMFKRYIIDDLKIFKIAKKY
ncbi:WecB/TagA/CpsF family glycosyltransferase [Clostridium baratii]|uniref:WecB/TagA/CpsF family glycosyltransferase n=1 Tax=Clostridium baratii TaxID=1561 RepID=UPI0030CC0E39